MRFDLTDLRLFIHVVEAGSLTHGAARAHMTLASASQRVRGMEQALGGPLLQRHAAGVTPTEAGRTLLHHARTVQAQMQCLYGEMAEHGQGLRSRVRLLANTAALMEHLPGPLADFLAAHPQVSVDLDERASTDVADAVRAGLADIGIASQLADFSGLVHHAFRRDDLVLVLPRGHALARRRRAALAELGDAELVGLAAGNPLQEHIARQARAAGLQPRYQVRVRSFDAVCRMAAQGIGAGIVPQTAAARCARAMSLSRVPLSDEWAGRELRACVRDEAALPPQARALLTHLTAVPARTGAA